ncbi:MAG: four helix bundle protein [Nonlabens sp.]
MTELQDHLSVAADEGFITSQLAEEFNNKIEECTRILNGYIRFLQKSKKED